MKTNTLDQGMLKVLIEEGKLDNPDDVFCDICEVDANNIHLNIIDMSGGCTWIVCNKCLELAREQKEELKEEELEEQEYQDDLYRYMEY